MLLRRNENIVTKALSGQGARIAECVVWIQREGGVAADCARGVVFVCDVAHRARLHLDCFESSWNLHMFSRCGYMISDRQ